MSPHPLALMPSMVNQGQGSIVYGQVTTPLPTNFSQPLYVTLPDWSTNFPFVINEWPALYGEALPTNGAAVMLAYDHRRNVRVIWWGGTYNSILEIDLLEYQVAGAIGVGNANADTAAFAAARDAAADFNQDDVAVTIYVPPGLFLINKTGIFSNLADPPMAGYIWRGAGKRATVLRLVPGGVPMWFYDNGSTQETFFAQWVDMGFQGDNTTNSNGFKFTSTGTEQGAQWHRCEFGGISTQGFGGTLFNFAGSVGNDSYKWFGCRMAFISGDMFLWNNAQAVTCELFGCNLELGYGNVFHIGTGGGGDLHVYGGDCLMDGFAASAPQTYYIQVDESSNVGKGNGAFHFHGVKFEIRSPTCSLVNAPSVSNLGGMDFHFEDCLFAVVNGNGLNGTSSGVGRTAVIVGNKRQVLFSHCSIPAEFNYTISPQASGAPANGTAGHIGFDACGFQIASGSTSDDISTRFTFSTNWGSARADRCFYGSNPAPSSQRYALDFDLGSALTAAGDVTSRRKMAAIFNVSQSWPGNTGVGEKTIILPKGCKIVGVYLLKPAQGANANNQTLNIGSSDKSIVYGTVSGAQDTQLTFTTALAPFQDTSADGSDPNQRTVRLWSVGAGLNTQANIGGYVYVEYI